MHQDPTDPLWMPTGQAGVPKSFLLSHPLSGLAQWLRALPDEGRTQDPQPGGGGGRVVRGKLEPETS